MIHSSRFETAPAAVRAEFFEAVLGASPDVIITTDEAGVIETCNEAIRPVFGYSPDEMLGERLALLQAGPDGAVVGACRRIEGRRKDGSVVPVSITLSEMTCADRRIYFAAIRDISAIREAEKGLEQATRELRRSNAALERFAAMAAFELQAPLESLTARLRRLPAQSVAINDRTREELRDAMAMAEDLKRSIEELLSLSRLDVRPPLYQSVSANEIVDSIAGEFAQAGAVTRGELPALKCDVEQVRRLFRDLIGNALKFRKPGLPSRVRVEADEDGLYWRFSVSDNGIGIDKADHDRIFDAFERVHPRGDFPGRGIGLAFSRKIVGGHGGRIWVESESGRGAKFIFTISKR